MSTLPELREKGKYALNLLLKVKKANEGSTISGLQSSIQDVVVLMEKEDIEWVEKVVGIKAID